MTVLRGGVECDLWGVEWSVTVVGSKVEWSVTIVGNGVDCDSCKGWSTVECAVEGGGKECGRCGICLRSGYVRIRSCKIR